MRLGHDPIAHPLIQRPPDHRGQQRPRILLTQSVDHQLRQSRQILVVAGFAHGEDQRDRLGHQAAGDKRQRLRRGPIEPLGIIHQAHQRLLAGHLGQQAQARPDPPKSDPAPPHRPTRTPSATHPAEALAGDQSDPASGRTTDPAPNTPAPSPTAHPRRAPPDTPTPAPPRTPTAPTCPPPAHHAPPKRRSDLPERRPTTDQGPRTRATDPATPSDTPTPWRRQSPAPPSRPAAPVNRRRPKDHYPHCRHVASAHHSSGNRKRSCMRRTRERR